MADRAAVVGPGHASTRFVPVRDIGSRAAHLEIHAAGQPVAQAKGIADRHLKVEVRVDEARCYDVAGSIHCFSPRKSVFADRNNATVLDADIGDIVIQGFRVYDPAVVDHKIIVLREGSRNGQQPGNKCCRGQMKLFCHWIFLFATVFRLG